MHETSRILFLLKTFGKKVMINKVKDKPTNIEWINNRWDELDLQDGASHLYPVHQFKQCYCIFGDISSIVMLPP